MTRTSVLGSGDVFDRFDARNSGERLPRLTPLMRLDTVRHGNAKSLT